MIVLDLSILNQKGTPMFNSDTFANRPTFGIVGRIFISTDTKEFFRDTGTSWELIGGPGSGTITGSGAAGQVTYFTGASSVAGSNNLFWDAANNHLGINTNTPGTSLDIHHNQSTILQLNQTTATNDTRIAFQNSGTALWRIGNFYTAGANDFGVFDVVGSLQQLTIVNTTGQTFIGAKTTAAGRLVINSATADAHLQVVGANSPSIRIDNAGSGGTQRFVFGLATATNNFIQGAAAGQFCISTQSSGAMLFGMWQTTNASEAMRISTANNLMVGTSIDTGQRFQISGDAFISKNTTQQLVIDYPSGGRLIISAQSSAFGFSLLDTQGYGFTHSNNQTTINARQTNVNIFTQAADTMTLGLGGQDVNPTIARTRTSIQPVNSPSTAFNPTSGTAVDYLFRTNGNSNFTPTSGTATYTQIQFSPTINQTGGANGITRGLFINPTLTAAADWRSIEWSNNTGFGLYGAGTCANYLAGNLLLGSSVDGGQKFQVTGTTRLNGESVIVSPSGITIRNGATDGFSFQQSAANSWSWTALTSGSNYNIQLASVGIGTATPDASSLLDVTSVGKGFLPPRMTTAQKNAITTPAAGLIVYDTTLNKLCVRTAATWETITSV